LNKQQVGAYEAMICCMKTYKFLANSGNVNVGMETHLKIPWDI